ncbi:MAG: type II secretion system minor pseudopilin GspI [Gammaproteobacteria bacterium]|nr:type II secretion system minor pseudopilin GspI [Gammaproteobacteria bacterium]
MNFNTTASHRGFTLLEVLVALTIITLSLGALISTSGSHASSAGYLKQKTIAHWVAMNEITQLRIEKAWPGKGDTKGSTEMAGAEWYWTRTVKETEDENSRQVEFKVFLDEARESSLTRLVVYLFKPAETTTPQL